MSPTKFLLLFLTGAVATLVWLHGDTRFRSPGELDESSVEQMHAAARPRMVFAPGRIEGRSREVEIRATINERVARIPVREGQRIATGQMLVELDSRQWLADLQLAEAQAAMALARQRRLLNGVRPSELEEARALQVGAAAAYRRAERLAQRTQELVSRGAASPQALDDEITQLATLRAAFDAADARLRTLAAPPREEDAAAADAEVEAARARVELARAALARSQITAPFDLQVLRIMAEPGELAGPQDLRPLLIVCDTNTLRVRAEVEEFDALQIELHQPVRITTDAENSPPMSGRVSQIAARMRQKQLHDERPNERLDATVREVWIDLYPDAKTAGRNCELVIGLPVEVCFLPHDTAVASIAD